MCLPARAIMVSLSISQSEERWVIGKKQHCGISDCGVFISLEQAAISWMNFFTNRWACEVEGELESREGGMGRGTDGFKMGGT